MKPQDRGNQYQVSALITGAAGGLGKAFAVECASRGWDLYLTDQLAPALGTLAAGLQSTYDVNVTHRVCDLTDPSSRAALFQDISERGFRSNFLINVAGVDFEGCFYEQQEEQIRKILRLNVEGTLAMTHAILGFRKPGHPFYLINVASLAAFYPMPVKATYAASKRFLLDFSLALREEVRPLNVYVTVLCPAGMPTNDECIQAIEAQGWLGQITTLDTGRVANQTLNAALRGKVVVIPGIINRFIQSIGSFMPAQLIAALINQRWSTVRAMRREKGLLPAETLNR